MTYTIADRRKSSMYKFNQKLSGKQLFYVYFLALLCAVSGFLLGYDTGIVSGAMVFIREHFHLNNQWHEFIVSITILLAAVSSMCSGILTDWLGRKPVIIISSFIFIPGGLICGLAVNKEMLFFGRLILGITIGLSSMTIPIYIAEVAPVNIRGRLVVINLTFIFFGEFLSGVIAALFAEFVDKDVGWRWMLGIAAVPSAIQFIGFIFLPESPRWLVRKGREDEARVVLAKVRNPHTVESELVAIREDCAETDRQNALNKNQFIVTKILKDANTRKALFVGCVLWIVHEFTGVNTIMYYCATIIQMSGIYNNNRLLWLAVVPPGVSAVCSIGALYFVEKLGRRWITLYSVVGLCISCIVIAAGFQVGYQESSKLTVGYQYPNNTEVCAVVDTCHQCVQQSSQCGFCFSVDGNFFNGTCLPANPQNSEQSMIGECVTGTQGESQVWANTFCPQPFKWTVFIGLILYLFFFSTGLGPTSWAVNAEIYPLWARSTCQAFGMAVNYISNFIVSLTFLTMSTNITTHGTFYFYAGVAFFGAIFFWYMLPETKGLTLEEIDTLFLTKKQRLALGDHNDDDVSNKPYGNGRNDSVLTVDDNITSNGRNGSVMFEDDSKTKQNGGNRLSVNDITSNKLVMKY